MRRSLRFICISADSDSANRWAEEREILSPIPTYMHMARDHSGNLKRVLCRRWLFSAARFAVDTCQPRWGLASGLSATKFTWGSPPGS
jgi:hypothetical protein